MRTYPHLQDAEDLENLRSNFDKSLDDVSNYQKLIAERTIGLFFKRWIVQEKYMERLEGYWYLQKIKAKIVIRYAINRRTQVVNYQKIKACNIIQSRILALIERKRLDARIEGFNAATTISRFSRIQHAVMVRSRLEKFALDLQFYDCPVCLEVLDATRVGLIQPCGHILCNSCFSAVKLKCPCCRLIYKRNSCKGVIGYLSKPGSPVYFTTEIPEKKSAISVIGWAMKRRLVARI
jgi:hypothetical protein